MIGECLSCIRHGEWALEKDEVRLAVCMAEADLIKGACEAHASVGDLCPDLRHPCLIRQSSTGSRDRQPTNTVCIAETGLLKGVNE